MCGHSSSIGMKGVSETSSAVFTLPSTADSDQDLDNDTGRMNFCGMQSSLQVFFGHTSS
jgi:hypothetical protein